VIGTTDCGNTKTVTRTIALDNTPAVAMIEAPISCEYVGGVYEIRGRASDAHFDHYELAFLGGSYADWQPIGDPVHTPVQPVGSGNPALGLRRGMPVGDIGGTWALLDRRANAAIRREPRPA
jgi:hypothetical protein